MRKLVLCLALLALAASGQAQRFAYVDTDYIIGKMPQYKAAQQQLNKLVEQWQKEIQSKQQTLDTLRQKLADEAVLLSPDEHKARSAEIEKKQKELEKLQLKRFGTDGELFKKQKELVKPIQNLIWQAVRKVAVKKHYDFIFDKGSDLIMLYTNSKWDVSREVLKMLQHH